MIKRRPLRLVPGSFRAVMWCLSLLLPAFMLMPRITVAGEALTLGIHPYRGSSELLQRFTPLAEHLGAAIGRSVRIEIAKDYQSHIEAVGENRLDIAYLGPAPYVRVVDGHGPKPILAQLEVDGRNTYRGVIIARRDSGLDTLGDLAGKRFAFGDPQSTMSHIVPRYMLLRNGITPDRLGGSAHLPNHMAVALGVLGGMFDAGAVKDDVFHDYEDRGLKALAWTPPIVTHLFVARSDLPQGIIATLRKVFHRLRSETYGSVILHAIKPTLTGMTHGHDGDYDNLRTILRTLSEPGGVP